ncbi:MAG: hypothetical protein J0L57_20600 [Burkholderiales bacterium]|nr:hypothetical protein [Burkholderiales bacterium]
MNSTRRLGLACVVALAATTALAGIKASGYRAGNFSFTTPTALVPLTTTGGTALTWNQGSAGKKIMTFSAECSVDAPAGNNFAWVDIDILHNGVAVPPTAGSSDGFCSADGVAGFAGYVRASITVVIPAVAGANTVQVLARLNAGATGGWVSDTSTLIVDP